MGRTGLLSPEETRILFENALLTGSLSVLIVFVPIGVFVWYVAEWAFCRSLRDSGVPVPSLHGRALRLRILVGIAIASGLFASITALWPEIEDRRDRLVARMAERSFAPRGEFYDLTDQLREAVRRSGGIDKARVAEAAGRLLETAQLYKSDWNYGNALHYGNLALARVALETGQVGQAKAYLLDAGRTPGSPQLGDYGSDMTLALQLLQIGEHDSVIEYLRLCKTFWFNRGRDCLGPWEQEIRSGAIPDFGSLAAGGRSEIPEPAPSDSTGR